MNVAQICSAWCADRSAFVGVVRVAAPLLGLPLASHILLLSSVCALAFSAFCAVCVRADERIVCIGELVS